MEHLIANKEPNIFISISNNTCQVLWRQPLTVLHYSVVEAVITLGEWVRLLASHTTVLALVGGILGLLLYEHCSLLSDHFFFLALYTRSTL